MGLLDQLVGQRCSLMWDMVTFSSDRVYTCEHWAVLQAIHLRGYLLRTYQTRSVHAYSLCIPYLFLFLRDFSGLLSCP